MIEIFENLEQDTLEWLLARAGIPTSSCFNLVQQKHGPRGGKPVGRIAYMRKLAGERITGEPMQNYVSYDMQRGKERQPEARAYYAMRFDVEPKQVGFVKSGNCGASPDYLVGKEGLLEVKDAAPHVQIERLEAGALPNDMLPQCYGQLLVTGRDWVDWMSHCRGLPPLILRLYRSEFIIAALRVDIDEFCAELEALETKIRSM